MDRIGNGVVRECCLSKAHFRLLSETPSLRIYQCDGPQADGTPCGRKHYVARLIGLDARAFGKGIGEP